MAENVAVHDVIKKKPALFVTVDMKKYWECSLNNNYYPILDILKSGLKTVKEIHDLYPAQTKKSGDLDASKSKKKKNI